MGLLGAVSYGVACLAFAFLGGLLLLSRQARAPGGRLIVAPLLTALWAATLACDCSGMRLPSTAVFMMHDLQNSAAQLQLIVANAAHHRHNPAFVDDAIDTIANAARRIGELIRQVKGEGSASVPQTIELEDLVIQTVRRCADRQPVPTIGPLSAACIHAELGKFASILGHVIRNAQHATAADGRVTVSLRTQNGAAHLAVDDTGCGTDVDFVRQRLFTPFDSTKGPSGMGIGAYQVREYVLAWAGRSG